MAQSFVNPTPSEMALAAFTALLTDARYGVAWVGAARFNEPPARLRDVGHEVYDRQQEGD